MMLSIQLPFTIFLQVYLTSSEEVMGIYKNSLLSKTILYAIGGIVTLLNIALFISMFQNVKLHSRLAYIFLPLCERLGIQTGGYPV